MGLMKLGIAGVGVLGPGLDGWPRACAVLAGGEPYHKTPFQPVPPQLLPANERRRANLSTRLALGVAAEACRHAGCDPQITAAVFASATGDTEIAHQLLESLADPAPTVSPTRFHNSVHNAAAGYFSIATSSHAASTSIAAGDASFASGLLLAASQVTCEERPVLLVSYDLPFPAPLGDTRPIAAPFACALVLVPPGSGRPLKLVFCPLDARRTTLEDPQLEALRLGVPAARSLPLLRALAQPDGVPTRISLPAGSGRVELEVDGAG